FIPLRAKTHCLILLYPAALPLEPTKGGMPLAEADSIPKLIV
ncbi:hypothetical protein EE612_042932, partial [Oryza sativa]